MGLIVLALLMVGTLGSGAVLSEIDIEPDNVLYYPQMLSEQIRKVVDKSPEYSARLIEKRTAEIEYLAQKGRDTGDSTQRLDQELADFDQRVFEQRIEGKSTVLVEERVFDAVAKHVEVLKALQESGTVPLQAQAHLANALNQSSKVLERLAPLNGTNVTG